MSEIKASIIAIGTEITTGQIVNKNASWISQALYSHGLATAWHLTVPDDKMLMQKALDIASADTDWIFLTGGLGPTSDDFTRDVVCAWTKKSTFFDEDSWKNVQERLTSRGYEIHEFQRQQCYFPEGSKVLKNSMGTANGFSLEHKEKMLFVLPGPPKEIEAVWNAHIDPWIKMKNASTDPWLVKSWDLLGLGESQVASMVEPIVKLDEYGVGYRVHMPYVEFKISYRKSQSAQLNETFKKLDAAFGDWAVLRDGQDIVQEWASLIPTASKWSLQDLVTEGFLFNRIQISIPHLLKTTFPLLSNQVVVPEGDYHFSLKKHGDLKAKATFSHKNQEKEEIIEAPYKTANMADRRQQYFAERALLFWHKALNSLKAR